MKLHSIYITILYLTFDSSFVNDTTVDLIVQLQSGPRETEGFENIIVPFLTK